MKIQVDYDLCEANQVCMRLAPSVFRVDDDDRLHLLVERPAPADLDAVREALRRCPRGALSLAPE